MTENESILINIIREYEDPEKALLKAMEIILLFLNHREAFESIFSVESREPV